MEEAGGGERFEMVVGRAPGARVPVKGSAEAAGFDLAASEAASIPPGGCRAVETGLQLRLGANCSARVASRSGLYLKHGIKAAGCCVPPLAGAALRVVLMNFSAEAFSVAPGDRIAQLVVEPCRAVRAVDATAD